MRMPGFVDVLDLHERRSLVHHVGALDDHIWRGELDDLGTHRLDRDERDVPFVVLGIVEHLTGGVIGDELDRHAQLFAKLAGEIDRDALWSIGTTLRQHRISEIDRGPQLSGWREVFRGIGTGLGHCGRSMGQRGEQQSGEQAGAYHVAFSLLRLVSAMRSASGAIGTSRLW
jgi:hypothetical protein